MARSALGDHPARRHARVLRALAILSAPGRHRPEAVATAVRVLRRAVPALLALDVAVCRLRDQVGR